MIKRILYLLLFLSALIFAQDDRHKEKNENLLKENSIEDRAAGTHNASNIGLFFENRGKLYPRRITQGPSGEFPINSGKNYIFRINQLVGIPGNVVQARYTDNEEWEALGGYHNPDLAKVAMSDNPATWHPITGWPVKDSNGNPIFKSDQDSYCAFSDSNNSRSILGIKVAQTGYTYGVKSASNIIFFKYDITNTSAKSYQGLYFGIYADIDVGNVSGGVAEYGDDLIGFDKENDFLYFYDDGLSNEWPENKTGQMGVSFLQTPEVDGQQFGITDMHYNLYFDDEDQDTIQYGILSSSESLKNSPLGSRYFHPGSQANIHFDDPSTLPANGDDIVANISSGPYSISPGDTLSFVTAIIAGETNEELYASLEVAKRIVEFKFDFSKPPANSNLSGTAGDSKVNLYWDDLAESSYDKFSNEYDFEGYRLYRSQDNGVTWTKLGEYDIKNFVGNDSGLKYSFVDSTVTNGFEYWYSITAFDKGNELIESLESSKGNTIDAINLISVTPQSAAIGRIPVGSAALEYIGSGNSNYSLKIDPSDNELLANNVYEISFDYAARNERGFLDSIYTELVIKDSSTTRDSSYVVEFVSLTSVNIFNSNTGDFVGPNPKSFRSGIKYFLNEGLDLIIHKRSPEVIEGYATGGEKLSIKYALNIIRNNTDTLLNKRPFQFEQITSTPDGIDIQFIKPDAIKNVSRVGGTDVLEINFGVDNGKNIINDNYVIRTSASFRDNNNEIKIHVVVTNSLEDTIVISDVANGGEILFNGIYGTIDFDESTPPSGTNLFSVTTEQPRVPTLLDKYRFTVKGSSIEKSAIARNLGNIKVVPNPYIVSSLYEIEFGELRQEPLRQLQFINLPNKCTIYIFSVDADLIKTLHHDAISGTEVWDLRAEGGREVAAGIYMYVVKTSDEEYKSRFAIIK